MSKAPTPTIKLYSYNLDAFEERVVSSVGELSQVLTGASVYWVEIEGFGDEAFREQIREMFNLHPLAIQDVVSERQRPKAEEYDEQIFIITKMLVMGEDKELTQEQISLFLGKNYVLMFQEHESDCFDSIRQRLRSSKSAHRKYSADYLLYSILDAVINSYYPYLEEYGEKLEALETEVALTAKPEVIRRIYRLKRELLTIRRAVWPQRDAINALIREDFDFITERTRLYLRDCYDHIVQIMDVVETDREIASSLHDVYLSGTSNRMNEVMRVLTIIGTIFIPLTFFAGVYGMNFEYLPEFKWKYGYLYFWLASLVTTGFMLYYFKRRGWLKSFTDPRKKPKDIF